MQRSIPSLAAGLLLVVALAACSANAAGPSGVASLESQGTGAESSAEPSASLDPETAQLEFAKCMRDHGIDMPDPETAPGGGFTQRIEVGKDDAEKMQAAQAACDHFLTDAGNFRDELDPEQLDKLIDFAQCMREHGIDMPDPATNGKGGMIFRSNGSAGSGGGPKNVTSDGIDPASPEFQAAQEACQSILGSDFGPKFEGGPATPAGPDTK
jgi:hypothetical protein